MQTFFHQAIQDRYSIIWGTVHSRNLPSVKTAKRCGRKVTERELFSTAIAVLTTGVAISVAVLANFSTLSIECVIFHYDCPNRGGESGIFPQ